MRFRKQNKMPVQSTDSLTLKYFWKTGLEFQKELWLTSFIVINSLCLYTLGPVFVGKVLASLSRPNVSIKGSIIGFTVVSIIGVLANRIGFKAYLSWQPKVMARLQAACLDMLLHRGMAFHNNRVSGKLVSDAADYPNAFGQLVSTSLTNILPFGVAIISGLIVISISSPLLGLLMLIMSILAIGSGVSQRKKMAPFRKARIKASKDVIAHLADTVVNVQTVKAFAHEDVELSEHVKLGNRLRDRRLHDWNLFAADGSNRIAILLVFQLIFLVTIVSLVHHSPALLATGIFAFSFTINLTNRLFEVGTIMRNIEEAFLLAEPTTIAMQEMVEISDVPNAPNLDISAGVITFNEVGFYYTDSSKYDEVFTKLNLTVAPGEKIGLVGPSGGGKTTITKLLLRFENIQHGSISIDGQDIAKVTQASLRASIAYVPQESLLFHRTVRQNISYGYADATLQEIEKAATEAYAHDFIMSLPKGYDTVVGERGVKLSGGQRQRIAIARAILKNAPILLLDEATSALDSESEVVIQKALWKLMESRTAIVIAHRLSTIQKMDRIIVLDGGKITEQGSHKELLAKKGLYARLWAHQSGGFLED
jgi:ATP-binding cassette subfamily B protein